MPFAKLTLKPGINTQVSKFASAATWVASNFIRWLNGQLRKLGGWQKFIPTPVIGTARGMHAWEDLNGNPYLIIGTDQRVEVVDGGLLEDITPLRTTTNPSPNFSTIATSAVVTIADTANGEDTGDWVFMNVQVSVGGLVLYGYYIVTVVDANTYTVTASTPATATVNNGGAVPLFTTINTQSHVTVTLDNHGLLAGQLFPINVSTAVGGVTLLGAYTVLSVTDSDNFVIDAGATATSSASASENGGDAQFLYLIHSGGENPTTLAGWGGGNWGAGDWGLDNGGSSALTPLRQWFFDYWGGDTIGNYTNGPMYIWMPPFSVNPRMVVISQAPSAQTAMFTAMPEQIIVSLGAEAMGDQDPNLIRWSDAGDYTDWTPSVSNQAGSFRIPTGSRIVGGLQTPLQALIWTDIDVYAMQYIAPPFVFGFTRVGQGCGLIAARAATVIGGAIYWMGTKQFYAYNGNVSPIPCDVWDVIFRDLDTGNADKIFAAKNSLFNEIWWFYPSISGATGEVDSYVKLNVAEGLWDYGLLVRTSWEDQSVLGPPIGVDGSGYIQQHEISNDADGLPMVSYATSSFSDLGNGEEYVFVDQLLPSFQDISNTTTLDLTLFYAKNTGSLVSNKGPYAVTSTTQYTPTRLRGRFVAIQVGSSDLGSFWQLGEMRYRFSDDGRFG